MKVLKTYNELFELNYSNQELSSLKKIPRIKEFDCSENQLKELPELPDTLEELNCSENQLKELPELPNTLEILYCSNNELPFDDLKEYKVWRAKDPDLTLKEKYRKHQRELKAQKFNL